MRELRVAIIAEYENHALGVKAARAGTLCPPREFLRHNLCFLAGVGVWLDLPDDTTCEAVDIDRWAMQVGHGAAH